MKQYDIIIIGGGVVGTAIARELSRYQLSIALLEKEVECAFGVSKSNSGVIHPGTQNPPHSLKGSLCVQGNRLIRRIVRELGVDFKEVGELIVAFTGEDKRRLIQLKEEARLLGVPRLSIVDAKWLRKREPNLNPDAIGALYAPTAGIISPYRLVYAMAENAVRNGVEIITSCPVTDIHRDAPHLFSIVTRDAVYRSRYLINAAGLFADTVAQMAGIYDFTIHPRKGEEFLLDKKLEYLTNHLIFPLPSADSKGVLVIKTADGNPMIGPTAEETMDRQDLSTTDAGLQKVLAGVRRLVPSIDEQDIIAYFAGLRPVAGDDFIIRHEDTVPGMATVAGIQSPGLTAAPAIAVLAVDILKKHGLSLSRKPFFTRYRKKTTHLFSLPVSAIQKQIRNDNSYGDIVCRCEMVSAKEVRDAIAGGAKTLDGIKFRTRAQGGRCHGSFCTTRLMKILAEENKVSLAEITKRGPGSPLIVKDKSNE